MRSSLALVALTATACLSHLPPAGHKHLAVNWQPSYAAAQAEAQRTGKPMLVCLVAGELDGLC